MPVSSSICSWPENGHALTGQNTSLVDDIVRVRSHPQEGTLPGYDQQLDAAGTGGLDGGDFGFIGGRVYIQEFKGWGQLQGGGGGWFLGGGGQQSIYN